MTRRQSLLQSSGREAAPVPVLAGITAYLDVHPIYDYEPLRSAGVAWIGLHRRYSSRQLAIVQQVRQTTTSNLKRFVQLSHLHIARPIALYSTGAEMHVAYEYIELGLRDLLPLFEVEVAAIMFQILDAVYYLIQNQVGFRISTIRISAKGHVKLVPDWNFETNISPILQSANLAYIALYLGEIMVEICPTQSPECISFIAELSSGSLPAKDHEFILQGSKPALLMDASKYALQKKIASIN